MKNLNEGISIAPATLGLVAERHVMLDLDIYGSDRGPDGDGGRPLSPDWA